MSNAGAQAAKIIRKDGVIVSRPSSPYKKPPKAEDDIAYTSDPREVRLSKPAAYLNWALDNYYWTIEQRAHLSALIFQNGETAAAARILKVHEDSLIWLRNRARSEVIMAAKRLDWLDQFTRDRRPAPKVKWVPLSAARPRQVWFPGQVDRLEYLFDLNLRRSPY